MRRGCGIGGEGGTAFFQNRAVNGPASELLETRDRGDIWPRKVPGCDDEKVKVFRLDLAGLLAGIL